MQEEEKTQERIGSKDLIISEVPTKANRSKRRMPESKVAPSPVIAIKVEKEVWEKALDLASGDAQRLDVRGTQEVIVWNNRSQARRLRPR